MTFLNWFRRKKEEIVTDQNAIAWLKTNGYWEPLPGTKAAANPKLYFPYADACAFALETEAQPMTVHVIHSEQDLSLYSDPAECQKAIEAGYCSPELRGRHFLVVRKRVS